MRRQRDHVLRCMPICAQQTIGHRIGVEPRATALGDLIGEAAQVLDQHDA